MKIYKVRALVYERAKEGLKIIYNDEEIIINNLDTAIEYFNKFKNQVNTWKGLPNITDGKCELFEPHIFKNGTLAYWPDDNKTELTYNF